MPFVTGFVHYFYGLNFYAQPGALLFVDDVLLASSIQDSMHWGGLQFAVW